MHISKITNNLKRYKQSKEARIVAGNFMWLSILQIASYALPFITMPYLARVIGVEGFGKIAFAAAIMVWIQTIADWGFNLTATRDIAQNRDNHQKVSEIFSNVLWARVLLMFISLAILIILIAIIPKFRTEWDVILVTFLMVPGHILFPDWFFQAIEKMKYISIFNVLTKLIFTIAVFVFIKTPEDYIFQPLLNSIGFIISGCISLYIIIAKWGIKIIAPNINNILSTIKNSTDVFINHLLPNMYNSFSTVLLGMFWGGSAVGILDGGNKFATVGGQIINTVERSFFPFLSRRIDKHSDYLKFNIGIATIIAIVLFFGAPLIVRTLLSSEFSESVWILRIRSISMIFYAISNAYGTNYILIKHKDKLLRQISLRCSIVGFIIAWPLVYFLSYIGASLTVTISIGLIAIYSYIKAKQLMKQNI